MYIKYLEYPPVPNELLPPVEQIINSKKMDIPHCGNVDPNDIFNSFSTRKVSTDLDQWIRDTFKCQYYANYQVLIGNNPIHVDLQHFPGARIIAFNYLLDQGGNNVITSVYDKEHTVLQSECIELHRWHMLRTSMPHNVMGVEPGRIRVALSVTPIMHAKGKKND